ncbi:resolvase, N-terminal domain protein [Bacteriovorax sp. BAL6_X]|uniref:recombinase family protein n=1 Tax=Bacteriovorax sp. BAL6_X TaxID=1201290 RepID=UPI000386C187|nr:recombinase family protein [Bacteriovorax sp. BAL6_X]EPZ52199.1 resolvase, N-terminal domain protein [Bacteriovorax sp. BAL6_X]
MKSKKAIYLRVSTQRQDLASQRLRAENYCKSQSYSVEDYLIYEDKISGAKSDRIALNKLIEDCRNDLIDTVIVVSLSRLSRSLRHLLDVANELASMSVKLISINEQIDFSTPIGKMILSVTGSIAELEKNQISDRVKRGLEHAKAQGKRIGRERVICRETVISLHKKSLTNIEISKIVKASPSSVSRIIKAYKLGETSAVS